MWGPGAFLHGTLSTARVGKNGLSKPWTGHLVLDIQVAGLWTRALLS